MPSKTGIVVTTIFDPAFLTGYLSSLRLFGNEEDTTLFIIPDKKTPTTVASAVSTARRKGFDVRCPSEPEQVEFLRKIRLPKDLIPWNTDNRRNVGFLMALADGCDVLISIDDDNFCLPGSDFVGQHQVVGTRARARGVSSPDGWFNECSLLEYGGGAEIFPRGFPYGARKTKRRVTTDHADNADEREREKKERPVIAINLGLWTGDPDVDAVTRLALAPRITRFKGRSVVLAQDTWSPINTQNTALTREAASVFYYVRMGYPLRGMTIDRYGDILSGYFVEKVAKHLGHAIRIGTPICEHRRTPHNLQKDLYHELAGIMIVEELLLWLKEVRLEGSSYPDAYESLAERLREQAGRFKGFIWDQGGRDFVVDIAACMQTWIQAAHRIG